MKANGCQQCYLTDNNDHPPLNPIFQLSHSETGCRVASWRWLQNRQEEFHIERIEHSVVLLREGVRLGSRRIDLSTFLHNLRSAPNEFQKAQFEQTKLR